MINPHDYYYYPQLSEDEAVPEIPEGLCQCGCEEVSGFYTRTRPHLGYVKGEPKKFKKGHNSRGVNHPMWHGGFTITNGYRYLWLPNHHRANKYGYVKEHIVIAERIVGKPLPPKAVIHHINHNPLDNSLCNLVVCENNIYHKYLHQRERAYRATGNPNAKYIRWLKRYVCQDPE